MSKHSRDIELLRQNDNDLMVQYEALLCLRAELARLLFPLKISPPRKYRFKRRNWSAACPVKQHERPASCAPILFKSYSQEASTAAPRLLYDDPMSASPDKFDPLFVVGNWLDACRRGEFDALLNLYDERATLECDCERFSLALSLNDMALTADGVRLDYQSYEGKPVRIHFRFGPSGKILHTSCGPLGRCTA